MKYYLISIAILLTSCTFSVNLVHTSGAASDVIDEDQKADPVVTSDLSIPAL